MLASANISKSLFVPDHQLAASEEEVVGLHVLGAASGEPRFFGRAQLNLERSDDFLREFVLHGEDIREVAIEVVGPDVCAARRIDQTGPSRAHDCPPCGHCLPARSARRVR